MAIRIKRIVSGRVVGGRFVPSKPSKNPKKGHRRNASDPLGTKIDRLLRDIYASQDPMQKERLFHGKTSKYKRMSKTYMSRLKRLDQLQRQYREQHGISENRRLRKR